MALSPRSVRRLLGSALAAVLITCATACGEDGAPDAAPASPSSVAATSVAVDEAVEAIDDGALLLDVRTPEEYAAGHLRGARNLDLADPGFAQEVRALDPDASYVVYCATGNRAGQAIEMMLDEGISMAVNGGGYDQLAQDGVPTMSGS